MKNLNTENTMQNICLLKNLFFYKQTGCNAALLEVFDTRVINHFLNESEVNWENWN
jgi:hypothetical protein